MGWPSVPVVCKTVLEVIPVMVSVEKLGGSVVTVDVKLGVASEEVVTGSCNTVEEPDTGPNVVDGAIMSEVGDPGGKFEGLAAASEVADSVTASEAVESVVDTAEELEVTDGKITSSEVDESVSERVVEFHPIAVSVVETPPVERGISVEREMATSLWSCGRGLASVSPSKRKGNKKEYMA